MRASALLAFAICLGTGAVDAAPFDNLPTFPCGAISKFELTQLEGASGSEVFALWLHGYAAGVAATEPNEVNEGVPNLVNLRDLVATICAENPSGEISASVLNRLLETID